MLDSNALQEEIANFKKNKLSRSPESRKAKKYLIEQLIARGFKRYEIAKKLDVSSKTIYNILNSTTKSSPNSIQ